MNFKEALQKIVAWIVVSSADPTEVSLTVKAALVAVLPMIMAVAGLAHVNLGDNQLTTVTNAIVMFIQGALTCVAAAMALYGIIRKRYYSAVSRTDE